VELSSRVQTIKPSPTLAVTARAAKLKAEGKDIIGLGAGEPDFDTPQHIKDAAIAAINKGLTKYTAVGGTPGLKNAIVAKFKRENNFDFDPKQILVSCGGKQSFFNLVLSVINPGDEVIIPAPYWLTYPEQVRASGGVPVIVDCPPSTGFKITADRLRAAITPRTVAFVLNSPSNPTGAVYTKEELLAIGRVLEENPHVNLISDDLYQKLVYAPAEFHSLPAMLPSLLPRTIIVNGLSKAYSMTGWRLGWAAGPKEFMEACANLQGQSTSNVTTFTQRAAAVGHHHRAAVREDQAVVRDKRRKMIVEGLNAIPGIKCAEPLGAFYAFPDVSGCFGKKVNGREITNSMSFSQILLEEANVSVVPGIAFGEDRCVRLSYATSETTIQKGLERLASALGK